MRFTLKNQRSLQCIDYQNVRKNGIFRLSKSGNIQKQVIDLIDPCFFDPVAKVFGTVITGSDEWIYHIHNVL